jgi:hypothetical protein
MDAREFMQGHADKACEGKVQEILGDLTPEAMAQLGPLMVGAPNPFRSNSVVPAGKEGDDHLFDVTYTGDGGGTLAMREWVRQVGDQWKIVKLAKP